MTTTIKLEDGKYTVTHDNGTNLRALRHGEPWRDLVGDGLVLAMAQRIEQLEVAHDTLVWAAHAAFTRSCERAESRLKWTQKDQDVHDTLRDTLAAFAKTNGDQVKPDSTKERTDACVAACASIPTYQLFGENREPNDLGAMIDTLREHRGDLVKALQVARKLIEGSQREVDGHLHPELLKAYDLVNDALAKVGAV